MVAGIYLITNKKTGQKYVGGSIDIERRIYQHKRSTVKGSYIDSAIKKYGWKNFSWQIITELPANWKIINQHEKYWINFYNTFENQKHYNLTEGGEGLCGWTHSKQTCKKISKAHSQDKNAHFRHDIDRNEIVKLYKKFWTMKEIAEKFNCSIHLVHDIVYNMMSKKEIEKIKKINNKKTQSFEAKEKRKESLTKNYPRIVKAGYDLKMRQRYAIKYDGKQWGRSIEKEKLIKRWYKKNPNIKLIDETE